MKSVERILKEVVLLPQHRETGFTRHYSGDVRLGKPAKLQIASFDEDDGFYLYYLDGRDECQNDTYHDTLDGAMKQAEIEFCVLPNEWIDVDIEQSREIDPAARAMAERLRKKLSEGAAKANDS